MKMVRIAQQTHFRNMLFIFIQLQPGVPLPGDIGLADFFQRPAPTLWQAA
jgi:hypothetical protein